MEERVRGEEGAETNQSSGWRFCTPTPGQLRIPIDTGGRPDGNRDRPDQNDETYCEGRFACYGCLNRRECFGR